MYYHEELEAVQKVLQITTLYIEAMECIKCELTYEPALQSLTKFMEQTVKPMSDFFEEMMKSEEMLIFEKNLEGDKTDD